MKSHATLPALEQRRRALTDLWLAGRITTHQFHRRLFTLCRHAYIPAPGRRAAA